MPRALQTASTKMASTEPPPPALVEGDAPAPTESEPLLGRPGDATQKPNEPLVKNFWLGEFLSRHKTSFPPGRHNKQKLTAVETPLD